MLARFWGTRGSIPVALDGSGVRRKLMRALRQANGRSFENDKEIERFIDDELDFPTQNGYGGNTSCVEIAEGDNRIICDFGSGARSLGIHIMSEPATEKNRTLHCVISHCHWDHIMGFPFFPPAYIPDFKINIYGCHPPLEKAFRQQQTAPYFPVHWEDLGADISIIRLEPNRPYEINGFKVTPKTQPHPDGSYGYRFERDGKVIVYSTDCEQKLESDEETQRTIDFYRDADLVIFDAMYSLADMVSIKEDWGHSSNVIGADICRHANVKHYCMFHHEPVLSDMAIHDVLRETIRYEELMREDHEMKISSAYDGMVIHV